MFDRRPRPKINGCTPSKPRTLAPTDARSYLWYTLEVPLSRPIASFASDAPTLRPRFRRSAALCSMLLIWSLLLSSLPAVAAVPAADAATASAAVPPPAQPATAPTKPEAAVRALIPSGATWQYLAASIAPSAWSAPGFDATTWPSGRAPFDAQAGPAVTVLRAAADQASDQPVAYFRASFAVADATAYRRLLLRVPQTAASAVYLNGAQVYGRFNQPGASAPAAERTDVSKYGYSEANIAPNLLRSGMNVVAVALYPSASPQDLRFDLELIGATGDAALAPTPGSPPAKTGGRAPAQNSSASVSIQALPSTPGVGSGFSSRPCESQPQDVVLVLDRSGSMSGAPIEDAKTAAKGFISGLNLNIDKVGLVSFSDSASLDYALTNNGTAVRSAIDSLYASGGTAIGEGIATAQAALTGAGRKVMVVLSDGENNAGRDPVAAAASAKAAGIYIISIALGAANQSVMSAIASSSSDFYYSPDSNTLTDSYLWASSTLRCRDEGSDPDPKDDPEPCPIGGAGDPVSLIDGSWYLAAPCFGIEGKGLPIQVSLEYSTRTWFDGLGSSNVGRGWTVGYTRRFVYDAAALRATLYLESGEDYVFPEPSSGVFIPPASFFMSAARDAATGEMTLNYRNGSKDVFRSDGSLKLIQDRFGNQTLVSFDGATGVLTLTNNRTNQSVVLEHAQQADADTGQQVWKLLRIKDGASNGGAVRTVTLAYASGRLTSVTDAAGFVQTFNYDAQGRIIRAYDQNNNPAVLGAAARAVQNAYAADTTGAPYKVTRQTLPNGVTVDFNWNTGVADYDLAVTYNAGLSDQRVVRYRHRRTGVNTGPLERIYMPNSTTAFVAMEYNNDGLLTKQTDPLGRQTEHVYDSNGNLTEIREYTGAVTYDSTQMQYDSFGRRTYLREPGGAITRWTYDAATGAVLTMTREATINGAFTTQTTTFETNAYGQTSAIKLPDGAWNTLSYDSRGYPATTTYDANYGGNTGRLALTASTTYDWRGFLASSADLRGVVTTYEHNNIGWRTAETLDNVTGGRAVRTTYSYDSVGNQTRVVEDAGSGRLNLAWDYAYALVGVEGGYGLTRKTNPLSQATTYAYTTYGELRQMVENGVRTTTFQYTPEGWRQRVTLADGRIAQELTYNAAGDVTRMKDARGVTTDLTYDAKGRLSAESFGAAAIGALPAINATYTHSYDADDRLTRITTPLGQNVLERVYDGFNRLQSETDGLNTTLYGYDTRNRLTSLTEGSNVAAEQLLIQYSYDAADRMTQRVIDPGAGRKNLTTRYRYTTTGSTDRWNLQEVQDPRSNTTIYRYNSLDLLSQITDALSSTWSYSYDNLSRATSMTDPLGRTTSYTVDALGRRLSLTRNGQTERWSYNFDDTLASSTDFSARVTEYSYDSAGRQTAIDYTPLSSTSNDVTFSYTASDLLSSMVDPLGATTYGYDALNRMTSRTRDGRTVGYSYDAHSRITAIDYWGRGSVGYGYDAADRMTSLAPWGAAATTYAYRSTNVISSQTRPNTVVSNYFYDTASRRTSAKHLKSGVITSNVASVLDANGNRIQTIDTTYGVTNATYDALNRLTSASDWDNVPGGVRPTANFTYDAVGNTTSFSGAGLSYDASDRITSAGYTYDANGNLLSDASGTTYEYDAANRLTKTVKAGVTTTYGYDGLGNLVRQTRGGVTTDFVLDENTDLAVVLGEISGANEQLYAYGAEGLSAQRLVQNGVGQSVVYPLLDSLGSVRQLTNSSGAAIKNYVYTSAFGDLRYQDSGSGSSILGFAGEQRNGDGTIHLRARTYQPTIGRFLQRDSFQGLMTAPQSLNRYSYAENNPTTYVDPSGHLVEGARPSANPLGRIFGPVSRALAPVGRALAPVGRAVGPVLRGVGGAAVGLILEGVFAQPVADGTIPPHLRQTPRPQTATRPSGSQAQGPANNIVPFNRNRQNPSRPPSPQPDGGGRRPPTPPTTAGDDCRCPQGFDALRRLGVDEEDIAHFMAGRPAMFIQRFPGGGVYGSVHLVGQRLVAGIMGIEDPSGSGQRLFLRLKDQANELARLCGANELQFYGATVRNPKIQRMLDRQGFQPTTIQNPASPYRYIPMEVLSKIFPVR
jgi:RHS repeat-associated protein